MSQCMTATVFCSFGFQCMCVCVDTTTEQIQQHNVCTVLSHIVTEEDIVQDDCISEKHNYCCNGGLDSHTLSGDCLQAPPARRGSGQVSLKDLDKLDKVTKRLKDIKTQTASNTSAARTISELESAVEKAGSDSSDDDKKL